MESLVGPKEQVLIKPNLVRKADLERAVVTHPSVVGAVARLLKEAGVRDVRAGDSCGIGSAQGHGGGCMEWIRFLARYGSAADRIYRGGNSSIMRMESRQNVFFCRRKVLEADAVISVCKMKDPCPGADHRRGEKSVRLHLWLP